MLFRKKGKGCTCGASRQTHRCTFGCGMTRDVSQPPTLCLTQTTQAKPGKQESQSSMRHGSSLADCSPKAGTADSRLVGRGPWALKEVCGILSSSLKCIIGKYTCWLQSCNISTQKENAPVRVRAVVAPAAGLVALEIQAVRRGVGQLVVFTAIVKHNRVPALQESIKVQSHVKN